MLFLISFKIINIIFITDFIIVGKLSTTELNTSDKRYNNVLINSGANSLIAFNISLTAVTINSAA